MKFKKIILTLLIVSMVLTSLPLSARQVDAADSEEMHEIVEQQVKAYADSIWEEGADQTSLRNLLKHSLHNSKNEPHLIMDESDATTVSLMNSNMLQEFLGYSISGTIELMQNLEKDKVYALGDAGWYSHNPNYAAYAYNIDQRVPSEILGLVANNASYSKDNFNDNDKALVLIVGAAAVACEIQEAKVNKNTILYDVKVNISDAFDFNGDYEDSKELGYDTSAAEWLTSVGAEFLNEFTWETNVEFQIEVPYESEQEDVTFSGAMNEIVEQQVKAYADSIWVEGADQTSMKGLIRHSLQNTNEEPHLIMDEDDATTISLMNSNMLQELLGYGIGGTIELMQEFERDKMYSFMNTAWYTHNATYIAYAHLTDDKAASERLGVVASSSTVHGAGGFPVDNFNDNDMSLTLVVGGASYKCEIEKREVKENTMVYDVRLNIKDGFDFNADYESGKELGYDTSEAELITSIGAGFLKEFTWESNVEFQIEAPYQCSHENGAYQWTMGEDGQLTCGTKEEGFIENPVTTEKYVPSSTTTATKDYYYHTLDEAVKLMHDKPWVMEYTGKKVQTLYFTQTTSASSMIPFFAHSYPKTAMFMGYETRTLTEEEKEILKEDSTAEIAKYIYHCYGIDTTNMYNKVYSKNTLRFRLENVVKGNFNMVYFSIYNEDTGETILEPTAMDDYHQRASYQKDRVLVDEENDWLSGKDFYFNHIGLKNYPLRADTFNLKVWENGEEAPTQSSLVMKEFTGSCIEQGTVTNECSECGYTITEYKGYTEHNYGSFKLNYDETCTEDGTETAICKECGKEKTQVLEGTAKGHSKQPVKGYAPTCLEEGLTDGEICSECDEIFVEQTIIPALGHKYGEFVSNNDATCEKDGTKTRTCELCEVTDTKADAGTKKAHTPVAVKGYAATCTKAGLTDGKECSVCKETLEGQDEIKPLGHKYGEFVSNNDATCGQDGTKTGTCSVCKEKITITDEGSGQAHTEKVVKGYAATCSKEGLTDGSVCTGCGATVVEQKKIEKLAHTEKQLQGRDATCTTDGLSDGSVCTVCNTTIKEQKVVKALGHMFGEYVSNNDATTSADGTKTRACIACSEKETVTDVGSMKDKVNTETGSQSSNNQSSNNQSSSRPSNKPASPTTGNEGFVKFIIPLVVSAVAILVVLKKKEMYQ